MTKKDKEIENTETTAATGEVITPEQVEQTTTGRIRKLTVTPTVDETSLHLNVDIIDYGQINFNLEAGELPQILLHRLALRGITSFVHDKTGSIKDVSKLPQVVEGVFAAVKDGTIFDSARTPSDTIVLPKFVEAAMVRDGLDTTDVVARQTALLIWNTMIEEDKKAMRSDILLKKLVAIANGEAAKKAMEVTE
jgi:hypothetical protein